MTPSQARQILQELIGGEDAFAAFFEKVPQDYLLFRASPSTREARTLLGADPLTALKAAEPELGERVELWSTMTVDASDMFPRIAELRRALETAFSGPITVNLHYSPSHAHSSDLDYDLEDILVIHLAGSTIWQVESGPRRFPNPWWNRSGDPRMAELEPSTYMTYTLWPGDLLYIPSGHWHAVEAHPGSMYLILGFRPLTVRDAIVALLDYLSDEFLDFRSPAFGLADVRSEMWPDAERRWDAASRQVAARLFDLFNRSAPLDAERLRQVLLDKRARFITTLPRRSGRVGEEEIGRIGLGTPVGIGDMIIGEVTANESTATLHYPFGTLSGPRRIEPALKHLLRKPQFIPGDLPGALSDTEKLTLVRRLARCGVIRRIDAAEDSQLGTGVGRGRSAEAAAAD